MRSARAKTMDYLIQLRGAARAGWWVITPVTIALTALGVPVSIANLLVVCQTATCSNQLNTSQVHQLQNLGISIPAFAYGYSFLLAFVPVFFLVVAYILFRQKSAGWMGLVGAYTLVLFGTITLTDLSTLISAAYPVLRLPVNLLDYLGNCLLPLFIILFPDGQINPRWSIWLVWAWAVLRVPSYLFPGSAIDTNTWSLWIQVPILIVFLGGLVVVQYYRYRKLYSPVLQQQTKWVVYGLMVSLVAFLSVQIGFSLVPTEVVQQGILYIFADSLVYLLMILIPLSLLMAMQRHQLWNIDLIINRTLVYALLTAILAGLYSASISFFQKVFIATTGARSDAALVISTFLLATTFTPIKNGLQAVVDRRYKETADPVKAVRDLDNQVKAVMDVLDARAVSHRLLHSALASLRASSGAFYLEKGNELVLAQASPGWQEAECQVRLPLEWEGKRLGIFCLGMRENGGAYTPEECDLVRQAASRVAQLLDNSPLSAASK